MDNARHGQASTAFSVAGLYTFMAGMADYALMAAAVNMLHEKVE
jgi:hypothetical protein